MAMMRFDLINKIDNVGVSRLYILWHGLELELYKTTNITQDVKIGL